MKTKSENLHFKIDTPQFLTEITDNALAATNMGVLKIPMNIFRTYLIKIAERAIELQDPIMDEIMWDMKLYETPSPRSPEYIKLQKQMTTEKL